MFWVWSSVRNSGNQRFLLPLQVFQATQAMDALLPTAAAMPPRLKESDELWKNNLICAQQEPRREETLDTWLWPILKEILLPQIWDIGIPESSHLSQAATVCKEEEILPKDHIPAWTLWRPSHSCCVLEQRCSGPETPAASSLSISLFARKDTIFDATFFFFFYLLQQIIFIFCFSEQLLGSQVKSVLRNGWVCWRTGWSPFSLFSKCSLKPWDRFKEGVERNLGTKCFH